MKTMTSKRNVCVNLILLILIAMCYPGAATAESPACTEQTPGLAAMERGKIRLIDDDGSVLNLEVLVADDNHERASGFQHICAEVIDEVFILFIYPAAFPGRFHMENVHAPLDIAFFDEAGQVVDVQLMQTYTGNSKPLYGPGVPFQFALEARQGFFADNGISAAGSRLVMASASD